MKPKLANLILEILIVEDKNSYEEDDFCYPISVKRRESDGRLIVRKGIAQCLIAKRMGWKSIIAYIIN